MSIYRTSDRLPQSDVHAQEAVEERWAPVPFGGASQINIELDQYQHMRKATPINRPFPQTLSWCASLPADIRPNALVRRYARIANLIAVSWGDRKWFRAYIESLLTDSRGNRRGFPPDVLSNLVALQRYRDSIESNSLTWDAVGRRG
jgi:hypothetical protein